jgi:hypothetical protein
MAKAHFILDNNVKHLKQSFPKGTAKTSVEYGLQPNADDLEVIEVAWKKKTVLVTTDVAFEAKCGKFQWQRNACMYGLLLLPDGKEHQERILEDIRKGRKVFRHRHYQRSVTWNDIREDNMSVNARVPGHPEVKELCDCEWKS